MIGEIFGEVFSDGCVVLRSQEGAGKYIFPNLCSLCVFVLGYSRSQKKK